MDNQDKLYNQIKSAAENAETKDFPSMDKVWTRVEEKLDKKVLTKQNSLWKKIAIAASLLLFFSITYQYLKEEKPIDTLKNDVTTIQSKKLVIDSVQNENTITTNDLVNPNIKENAQGILEKQINGSKSTATIEPVKSTISEIYKEEIETVNVPLIIIPSSTPAPKSNSNWLVDPKFESRGVAYKDNLVDENEKSSEPKPEQKVKKDKPLIVMSDKNSNLNTISSGDYKLSNLTEEEIDSIIHLPNPLYIINGVYYTEVELFGPNPTSPYAPITKQKIETISILQDEKAISIYGEKGKEGVVIITTKDGKPTPIKR